MEDAEEYVLLLFMRNFSHTSFGPKEMFKAHEEGKLSSHDLRDGLRCHLTEQLSGKCVVAMDKRKFNDGCISLTNGRNFNMDVSCHRGMATTRLDVMKGKTAEVVMDYCWWQHGYCEEQLTEVF